MKQELETLREELHSIVDSKIDKLIKPVQPQLNKWSIIETDGFANKRYKWLVFTTEINSTNEVVGYGFDLDNNNYFKTERVLNLSSIITCIEAAPTEVQQALEKEAVKRGFKEGVEVKYIVVQSTGIIVNGYENEFRESDNAFYFNNILVFEKGVWAEIVNPMSLDEICDYLKHGTGAFIKNYLTENKTQIIETLNNL